jgi:hypothetical protein
MIRWRTRSASVRERVQGTGECGAIRQHALVVRRDPHRRRQTLEPRERAPELAEVGRCVAVVRAEAREVDVADEGDAVRLDQQHVVTGGMARHVHGAHAHAAQIPDRAVGVGDGVRPRHIVELGLDLRLQRAQHRWRVAVVAAEALPASCGGEVGLVHVHRHLPQALQPGHVVLVYMAQDHELD